VLRGGRPRAAYNAGFANSRLPFAGPVLAYLPWCNLSNPGVRALLLITEPVPMTLLSISFQGKLLGAWVDEARKIVTTAKVSERVCLDLQALTFADARGVELLRNLRKEGVPLLGCSPLIEGLLAFSDSATTAIDKTDCSHG